MANQSAPPAFCLDPPVTPLPDQTPPVSYFGRKLIDHRGCYDWEGRLRSAPAPVAAAAATGA